MTAKVRVRAAVLATFIVVLGTAGVATKQFGTTATASPSAVLTVFLGSVQVAPASSGAPVWGAGHTGDTLAQGGSVRTGPDSKAALTLPDGSVTRLDGSTELQLTTLVKAGSGGHTTALYQASGATWNSVRQLVSGGRYSVRAPNNSTAEVRGTDFSFVVDSTDAKIDVWAGAVVVTGSNNAEVTVPTGQTTVVHQNAAPEQPRAIPVEDKRSTFTVFNQTVAAVGHTPTKVKGDSAAPGAVSAVTPAATTKGDSDLTFSLGWPGSTFELTVIGPDGSVTSRSSSQPPVTLVIPHAKAGNWSYQVRDIESDPSESYWVAVSSTKAEPTTPVKESSNGSSESSGSAVPSKPITRATPTAKPTPAPTASNNSNSDSQDAQNSQSKDAGQGNNKSTPTPAPAGGNSDQGSSGGGQSNSDNEGDKTPTPKPTGGGDQGDQGDKPGPAPVPTPKPNGGGDQGDQGDRPGPTPVPAPKPSGGGDQGDQGDKPGPAPKPGPVPAPKPSGGGDQGDQGDKPPPVPVVKTPVATPVPKRTDDGGDNQPAPPPVKPPATRPPPGLPSHIPQRPTNGGGDGNGSSNGQGNSAVPKRSDARLTDPVRLPSAQPGRDEASSPQGD